MVAACLPQSTSDGRVSEPVSQPAVSSLPSTAPSDVPDTAVTPSPSVSSPTRSAPSTLVRVPSAPPARIDISAIGVHADVGSLAASYDSAGVYGLYPPEATWDDLTRAYWWNERSAPGNPSSGTTFIIGHTCHAQGCPAVFNRLQDVQKGTFVTVTTPNGALTYRIFRTQTYPKSAITNVDEVYKNVPNRLVLVTCKLRSDGGVQTDNFVAWATLVGSQSTNMQN